VAAELGAVATVKLPAGAGGCAIASAFRCEAPLRRRCSKYEIKRTVVVAGTAVPWLVR
jgi:hypothetical protein